MSVKINPNNCLILQICCQSLVFNKNTYSLIQFSTMFLSIKIFRFNSLLIFRFYDVFNAFSSILPESFTASYIFLGDSFHYVRPLLPGNIISILSVGSSNSNSFSERPPELGYGRISHERTETWKKSQRASTILDFRACIVYEES